MDYYIKHGEKERGPCTLKELRSFLYYGSIRWEDTVRAGGAEDWIPMSAIEELADLNPSAETTKGKWLKEGPKPPARVRRFREYASVPKERQAGYVISKMLFGFVFWPPDLWRAASMVFSANICRHQKDENGYLKVWPRSMEIVVTVLVLINATLWTVGTMWAAPKVKTVAREVVEQSRFAMKELQDFGKEHANDLKP
jgi:GYF domain 2